MIVTKELRAKIRAHRELSEDVDGKQVPGSVSFLRKQIAIVQDPLDRDALLVELAGEYLRADLDDEHLRVQRERVANHPEAAVTWLGLAHSLSMRTDGAEEAKRTVAKAIEISRREDALIRYSLRCQAEIARATGDSKLFEQALEELIADAPNDREDDCNLPDQIVEDLPAGLCSPALELRYRRLLNPDDSDQDEPESPRLS